MSFPAQAHWCAIFINSWTSAPMACAKPDVVCSMSWILCIANYVDLFISWLSLDSISFIKLLVSFKICLSLVCALFSFSICSSIILRSLFFWSILFLLSDVTGDFICFSIAFKVSDLLLSESSICCFSRILLSKSWDLTESCFLSNWSSWISLRVSWRVFWEKPIVQKRTQNNSDIGLYMVYNLDKNCYQLPILIRSQYGYTQRAGFCAVANPWFLKPGRAKLLPGLKFVF